MLIYYIFLGVQKDTNQALDYFHKAANNGYAGSLNVLGTMYMRGTSVPKNLEKAYSCYANAAALGMLSTFSAFYVTGDKL